MRKWAAFWLVALIWGSSFLFIRIGVEQLSPFQVLFIRTWIAAVGLNLLLASYRFEKPIFEIMRAVLPMLCVLFIGVLLITYFPPLTTWLPNLFAPNALAVPP